MQLMLSGRIACRSSDDAAAGTQVSLSSETSLPAEVVFGNVPITNTVLKGASIVSNVTNYI